jgi:hypothetical protein
MRVEVDAIAIRVALTPVDLAVAGAGWRCDDRGIERTRRRSRSASPGLVADATTVVGVVAELGRAAWRVREPATHITMLPIIDGITSA